MSSPAPPSAPSGALESALGLLQGDSDESVFAGLLMLAKHVPAEEFSLHKASVIHAIPNGAQFFKRLLASATEYQLVALAVIRALCSEDNPLEDAALLQLRPCTPGLAHLVQVADSLHIVEDAAICLASILKAHKDQTPAEEWNTEPEFVQGLVRLLSNGEGIKPSQLVALDLLQRCKPELLSLKHLSELGKLAAQERSEAFVIVVQILASAVRCMPSETLLLRRALKDSDDRNEVETAIAAIAKAVFTIFRSGENAPASHREVVLDLAQALCASAGPGWPGLSGSPLGESVVLLLNMVNIEVTVALTNLRSIFQASAARPDETTHTASPRSATAAFLASCSIFEFGIDFCTGDFEFSDQVPGELQWNQLESKHLLKCRRAFFDTVSSIVQFAGLLRNNSIPQTVIASDPNAMAMLGAGARVVASWLSDGPDEEIRTLEVANEQEPLHVPGTGGLETLCFLAQFPNCTGTVLPAINIHAQANSDSNLILERHRAALSGRLVQAMLQAAEKAFVHTTASERIPLLIELLECGALLIAQLEFDPKSVPETMAETAARDEALEKCRQVELSSSVPQLSDVPQEAKHELEFLQAQAHAAVTYIALTLELAQAPTTAKASPFPAHARALLANLRRCMADDESLRSFVVAPLLRLVEGL